MNIYKELFLSTTDTVVGLGAPISPKNMETIFLIKERPKTKPLLIMVDSIEEAQKFKGWNDNAEALAKKYWPGQVTIVLDEVGIRIPNNKELISLIKKTGPVYMTSANKTGSTTMDLNEAIETFPEIKKHYDFGKGTNTASTIVRAKDLSIIRQGDVKIEI